jgi:hypothetical protein
MHLTDHLTDEQLNEYLDNETNEREPIESHLAVCADCAARFSALQTLFSELDSLPELTLSTNLAARFMTHPSRLAQLPRWLTLTAILQAVIALIILVVAAPFVTNLLPEIKTSSYTEILIHIEAQWLTLFNTFTSYQLPTLPSLPPLQFSTLTLSVTLVATSLLWLVGNGLLLRNYIRR